MSAFIIVAAMLVVAIIAILLPPLWRLPKPSGSGDRREANLAIFRDQVAELEREREDGSLAEADFVQAQAELQRRLLDEVECSRRRRPPRPQTALALLLIVPLATAAGYLLLGDARDPLQRQARIAPEQIEGALRPGRAEELTTQGLDAGAFGHKVLGASRAADAYGRASALVTKTRHCSPIMPGPRIKTATCRVADRAHRAVAEATPTNHRRCCSLAPPPAIGGLCATADTGRVCWPSQAGVDDAKPSRQQQKAREIAATQSGGGKSAGSRRRWRGQREVTLSGKLAGQVKPDDVLFVFARSQEGPRMPLAATRATVADLPLSFRFDDSMALAGGKKLSDFATVSIEARIVKAGQAQSSSGDLFGTLTGVKPGSHKLRLLIDQVQP
jgi:cytochrome c-type biogenesis protein CcmH